MKKTNRAVILVGVIMAMLLSALDQTIVATAMPQVVRELNGLSHLSWVFTAYMLAATVTLPIYGKLSDLFGRKGLFILGIIIFMVGSMLSGISQNMTQLIFFRGLQGIGAGAIMVNAFAIIGDLYSPAERGRYQGLMGGVFGLATIVGPLLGGWLTDNYTWRWVFYVNIPVGIIAISILATAMPRIVHDVKSRAIDFVGAALITAGLVPLLLGFVWAGSEYAWGSWQIITLLIIAALALLAFGLAERKAKEPVLSLNLFQNRVFAVSTAVTFLTAASMFGAILYITVFAQGVIGVSATNSGLILMPMMIGLIFASALSGQLISRTGKYKVLTIIGVAIAALAMFFFSQLSPATTVTALRLRMVLLGLGLGVTMPVFTVVVQSAFSTSRLGEVTAGITLFRSLGGTVGTAVLGGIMNSQLASHLANIQNEPFVATIKQLAPSQALGNIDANAVQRLLSVQGQTQVRDMLTQVPPALQSQLSASFDHFLNAIKSAFSSSLDYVFIISMILMVAALLTVFFLPEITLRQTRHQTAAETGAEPEGDKEVTGKRRRLSQ
ncbi:MAG: MFS transporter [Chloroflexi bacterium]|nr:MFS transporter [Chloroflexota bacterium]